MIDKDEILGECEDKINSIEKAQLLIYRNKYLRSIIVKIEQGEVK